MRKIKKINGFLVVRFNDREKRNYPDLGSFGVIDAEQYTGDIDFDRDAMEYTDADCIEVAVEQARGLESESDFSEEPPVCTVIVESDAECSEEEVEPQLMIAGWEQQLETQVESKHYPDIDAKAAAHELHGFKVALYRLGMIGKSETEVDPRPLRAEQAGGAGADQPNRDGARHLHPCEQGHPKRVDGAEGLRPGAYACPGLPAERLQGLPQHLQHGPRAGRRDREGG